MIRLNFKLSFGKKKNPSFFMTENDVNQRKNKFLALLGSKVISIKVMEILLHARGIELVEPNFINFLT